MIQEIKLDNTLPNQSKNLILNQQQCSIIVKTCDLLDDNLQHDGYYTAVDVFLGNIPCAGGHYAKWGNDLISFVEPRNTDQKLTGAMFFYSPYIKTRPLFNEFGTTYKLFYSDKYIIDSNVLDAYFK